MTDSLWFHARHLILLIIGHSHLYDLMIWKYLLYILWVNWVSELHCFFILKCTFKTYAKQSLGGSAINILALEECLITLMFTDGSKGVFFELNLKSSDPFSVPQDVLSPGAPGTASVSHFQFTTGEGGIWVVVLQPFFCVQFFGFVLVIPPPQQLLTVHYKSSKSHSFTQGTLCYHAILASIVRRAPKRQSVWCESETWSYLKALYYTKLILLYGF